MNARLDVWAPLPPAVYLRRPARRLPYPLEDPRCRVVAWARHGVWHGVQRLGLAQGDQVIVPAYHHGSEVEALARAGIGCRFYDATDSLAPDQGELEGLVGERVRALHLVHYLGFPQDAERWRRWCDERGLLLIEDAAQAWLAARDGSPVGSYGHLSVFCLYKSVGLPEGAAVLQDDPAPPVGLDRRPGVREIARRHGMWLASRSALAYAAAAPFRRSAPYDPLRDFELRDPASAPWSTTPFLLRRLADPTVATRRRANYQALLDRLGALVPSPFGELPPGASPFAFPLATHEKRELLDRLGARGIRALDLWSTPHPSLPAADFPGAARRREMTVGLPVHQELRRTDLERIAEAVLEATG